MLGFHDLGYMISFQFGNMSMTSLPSLGSNSMDNEEITVRYSQIYIGSLDTFFTALRRYCELVKMAGKTRTFKTNVARSFSRQGLARCGRAHLTTMQIINHPKFEGPWPSEEPERLSPWSTLSHWHKKLHPIWWAKLKDTLSMRLLDGGELTCSYEIGEINFNWAGMYGAMILGDKKFSSHT